MFLRAGQLYCLRGYCESGIEDALRVEFVTFCHLESPLEVTVAARGGLAVVSSYRPAVVVR